tara:strand:+ start:1571 stop:1942 length:372 start_codon:yes stop_codon:yes gene_type:complete
MTTLTNELLQSALESSGVHSGVSMEQLDAEQRKVFGLLEAIDFDCFDREYPCISLGENTMEDVEQYIVENFDRVKPIPLPSALGLVTGVYSFLPLSIQDVYEGLNIGLDSRLKMLEARVRDTA